MGEELGCSTPTRSFWTAKRSCLGGEEVRSEASDKASTCPSRNMVIEKDGKFRTMFYLKYFEALMEVKGRKEKG